ncbi:hypothetical protein HNR06_001831 [Nocardiopsis arvandica]|uniref:Uncharacterized protein n=1 Tax=Nocardiopsis sinuspersici TaxID=501010 RepID=A0A7Y9XC88_9ACTN|nr:hypothetical protein [Nocardiopsis sinuspersici]
MAGLIGLGADLGLGESDREVVGEGGEQVAAYLVASG